MKRNYIERGKRIIHTVVILQNTATVTSYLGFFKSL